MQSQPQASHLPQEAAIPADKDSKPELLAAASKHSETKMACDEDRVNNNPEDFSKMQTLSSCIGLGIVASVTRTIPTTDDAQEDFIKTYEEREAAQLACKKAIEEALDRSTSASLIEGLSAQQHRLRYVIHLGVPAQLHKPDTPIEVDQRSLEAFVMTLVRHPIDVAVTSTLGGLWNALFRDESKQKGSLAVVASVSMLQNTPRPNQPKRAETAESRQVTSSSCEQKSSRMEISPSLQATTALEASFESKESRRPHASHQLEATTFPPSPFLHAAIPQALAAAYAVSPPPQAVASPRVDTDATPAAAPPVPVLRDFRRSSSIDVLAHVSAEIRDQQQQPQKEEVKHPTQMNAILSLATTSPPIQPMPQSHPQSLPVMMAVERAPNKNAVEGSNNTNYKKLPEGKTPKNNTRLFVRHPYTDHSREAPLSPEEQVVRSTEKTANAAFPLKLHEILSEIERDGHDDIIGWLPHGRAFKIHKQQEFVDVVLSKYFSGVSKKSSFNRQLNLYNFRRLSGVGPDQGAYYHELFLRGMAFLTRRMQRCKVNGNRIRAAGNPDEEPVLANYPACPRSPLPKLDQCQVSQRPPLSAIAPAPPRQDLAATAAVLQYMATQQQQRHPASPPISSVGQVDTMASLLGLVPASASGAAQSQSSLLTNASASESPSKPKQKKRDSSSAQGGAKATRASSLASEGTSNSGASVGFPLKLQRILDKLESDGNNAVVSWLSHGRAFMVHNPDRFVQEIQPEYFNQSKYSSFQRQLHMYNFQRITTGRDKGAYHHPQFLRGQPSLCQKMQRTRVNGKGTRQPGNPQSEPDFYAEAALPHIAMGSIVEIPSHVVLFSSGKNTSNGVSSEGAPDQKQQQGAPSVSSSSYETESEDEN